MYLVLGLGKTGVSCIRYLVSRGLPVAAADSRMQPPDVQAIQQEFPQVPIALGGFPVHLVKRAKEILLSPGLSLQEPAIAQAITNGIAVSGDIEWFARAAKAPIIAITGTNAKGTVTTLLGLMAEYAGQRVLLGGNIGTPALQLLEQPVPDWYILELSSFQLETTQNLKPYAAAILNISPDHLDRYQDLNHYVSAKQRIYQHCQHIVYFRDQALTKPAFDDTPCLTFGINAPASTQEFGIIQQDQQFWLANGSQRLINVDDLRIKGRHNWLNALAALALGRTMGLPLPAMLWALTDFTGLPHRCQWLGQANEVSWFNDSKATNVGSALAALEGLGPAIPGKLILLAGGVGKGADFMPLQQPIAQYVRHAIVFGQDAAPLMQMMAPVVPVNQAADLAAAVTLANKLAQPGDAVLLAPACASLDMFTDYNQRGEVFRALVEEILCQ